MLDTQIISIFLVGCLGTCIQSVLSPFFPGEAKDKGVNNTMVGLMFGIQPLVASICSPILGMILFKVGRKRILLISAFMLGCSSFSFALLPNLPKNGFIVIGFLSRIFQGVGGAGCAVSIVAIISSNYKDEMEKMFGIQQTLTGVAMIIGPVIGLALYAIGGFSCIFYVLSAIFFTTLTYLFFKLPGDKASILTKEPVSWIMLLRVKAIPLDCILISLAFGSLGAIEPILGNFLNKEFDIDPSMSALVFIIPTIAYPLSVFASKKYFGHVRSSAKMFFGLMMIALSLFLVGPVTISGISPSLPITLLGVAGIGGGLGLSMVPALPDMVNFATDELPHIEAFLISDRVSSLINLFMYVGKGVFAPICGVLTDKFEFEDALGILGVVTLIYALFFRYKTIQLYSSKSLTRPDPLIEKEMKEPTKSFYSLEEDEV